MRRITFVVLIVLFFSFLLKAQNADTAEVFTKKGWNFGILPAVSFNSDLGFQYGGLVNFFHYGDGSRYPSYDHSFYFEVSRYTKGSGLIRFAYDSDQLLPNMRLSFDASYMPEQAIDFLDLTAMMPFIRPIGLTTHIPITAAGCFTNINAIW